MSEHQKTCAACVYAIDAPFDLSQAGQPRARDCRRFPPAIALVPTRGGASTMALPRIVAPNHWCHEFELDDVAIPDVVTNVVSDTLSDVSSNR